MNKVLVIKERRRAARKSRIRKSIRGTAAKPRVTIYFSNRNVIAQMIDDEAGKTIAAVTTFGGASTVTGKSKAAARQVGAELAEKAMNLGVTTAVFDRNGYMYHGRVKEIADAMREKGLLM